METTYAHSDRLPNALARRRPWAGLALSGLGAAFLLFDAAIKLVNIAPVTESFVHLGYPAELARGIGLLELVCLVLYLVPRSAGLGAVLLTGFLGGAIASHVRIGDPPFSHCLFPVYVGLFLWGGLVLRDARLRGLFAAPERPST